MERVLNVDVIEHLFSKKLHVVHEWMLSKNTWFHKILKHSHHLNSFPYWCLCMFVHVSADRQLTSLWRSPMQTDVKVLSSATTFWECNKIYSVQKTCRIPHRWKNFNVCPGRLLTMRKPNLVSIFSQQQQNHTHQPMFSHVPHLDRQGSKSMRIRHLCRPKMSPICANGNLLR